MSNIKPPVVHTADFEVFGKVQGVYFRKYTQKKALDLGIKGWVMNTPQGTVIGQLQGAPEKVQAMKSWLQLVGSPKSRIGKSIENLMEMAENKAVTMATSDFEVFGKVQGVYFGKHTQKKANELGLKGWVMNTAQGTVVGQLQGSPKALQEMKNWLKTVGSPKSKIEKATFRNESAIKNCAFKYFEIRR